MKEEENEPRRREEREGKINRQATVARRIVSSDLGSGKDHAEKTGKGQRSDLKPLWSS